MRILFPISILCFFILFATVLALVKKVLEGQRMLREREQQSIRMASFSALERTNTARMSNPPMAETDSLDQKVHDFAPHKSPDFRYMTNPGRAHPALRPAPFLPGERKRPQAAFGSTHERLDWAYFNKDLGDLSDPYEPMKPTGTADLINRSPRRDQQA